MNSKLNPWQRFWGLFVLVLLASTIAVIAALWPRHDPGVVADLRAPECAEWRGLPAGVFPGAPPEANEPCRSIRALLYQKRVVVRSEDDYAGYLLGARARISLICLGWWAGFVGGIYVLGWASSRLVSIIRQARLQKVT